MPLPPTVIDVTEDFPVLPHAPITEAVIGIHSRPEDGWDEKTVSSAFKAQLTDYPEQQPQRSMQGKVKLTFQKGVPSGPPDTTVSDLGFYGVRAISSDRKQIVQLLRDNFVFSRLAPYEKWENFRDEGIRVWKIYTEFGSRTEIQRLDLRFINQIPLGPGGA